MLSEIGSNFWIDPNEIHDSEAYITPDLFGITGNDYSWLSTGRSAISLVLETIKQRNPSVKKTALIPSFTCNTVIEPFLKHGYDIKLLPIKNGDLCTDGDCLLTAAEEANAGVLLIHRYFGFDSLPTCEKSLSKIKRLGVKIIEDKTQCLYSNLPELKADYTIASIRKWLGVPDGAFAVCAEGIFDNKPQKTDSALETAKIEASLLKYNHLFKGEGKKQAFLDKYRIAEEILNNQAERYSIGNFSLKMQTTLNIDWMKSRRRLNFSHLLNGLSNITGLSPTFPKLPENVVPLYCPIFVGDRKALQQHLVANSIYAPIVWPKADVLPNVCVEADYLYEHLLCIPIDQRYDCNDMQRIIDCINDLFQRKVSAGMKR